MKPQQNEYAPFFENYVSLGFDKAATINETLSASLVDFKDLLTALPKEKQLFAYDKGKWTIKELISHMIDTERIMAYRALRIARNDKSDLLAFDENNFVAHSNAIEIPYTALIQEFSLVRKSTIAMYKSFNSELLQRIGTASGATLSVNALGYIISGHVLHHLDIIVERYL